MATPTEHASRDYAAYLRGPAGLNTYAFTTTSSPASVRSGIAHSPQISVIPAPIDSAPDTFGIMTIETFDVEIFDEPNDDDWPILDQTGDFIQSNDGTAYLVQNY
jgi:hypothetical protein